MPFLRLRELAWPTLPVRQFLFAIVRLAEASGFPTTVGTLHGVRAMEKVRETSGAGL